MSTTMGFVQNFNSDNLSSTVVNYFDEIMVLYNLVGQRQDLDICTDNNDASLATFTLLTESEDDAKDIYDTLNNSSFSVYGDLYEINMELNKASIKTTITKAVS